MTYIFRITPKPDSDPRILGLELTTQVGQWKLTSEGLYIEVDDPPDAETMERLCQCHPGVASWSYWGPRPYQQISVRDERPECWRRN